MRKAIVAVAVVVFIGTPAFAAGGLITKRSQHSVADTMDRLEKAVTERGFVVVARVDHADAAQKAGLSLRPTQILIFGNPRAGTPLMQSAQTVGIDLPLKALVWEDDKGEVWLGYNDPAWIAERHGIKEPAQVVKAMTSALDGLTDLATKAGN
jgi:uncharacterized protein (DUF302 family)